MTLLEESFSIKIVGKTGLLTVIHLGWYETIKPARFTRNGFIIFLHQQASLHASK
jgi:hypothetical protein